MKKNEALKESFDVGELDQGETLDQMRDYELSLRLALQRANEGQIVKQRFLSIISHEILTPITSIITLSSLLSSANAPQDQEEFIGEIDSAAHDLWEVFNNMIDYAMLGVKPYQLDDDYFDPKDVAERAIKAASAKAQQKKIKTVLTVDHEVPLHVGGDAGLLQKALEKLLLNAIKYSDQGTVALTIQVDHNHSNPDGVSLHLEVVDQGIGIPTALQTEIFDRFATSNAFHQKRQGGTGLGLTICKQIVTVLGGEIGVRSIEGQGSTFWCDIPFKEFISKERAIPLAPLKILFVDTIHPIKFQWVSKLIHWGMEVDVIRDLGNRSLKSISHQSYDCVLMRAADVNLAEHYQSHLKSLKNQSFQDASYIMIQMPSHLTFEAPKDWLAVLKVPLQDEEMQAALAQVTRLDI